MSLTPKGRVHIVFGVDPVGVSVEFGIGVALVWHFLVCTVSCEPQVGWLVSYQIFMGIYLGHNKEQQ